MSGLGAAVGQLDGRVFGSEVRPVITRAHWAETDKFWRHGSMESGRAVAVGQARHRHGMRQRLWLSRPLAGRGGAGSGPRMKASKGFTPRSRVSARP